MSLAMPVKFCDPGMLLPFLYTPGGVSNVCLDSRPDPHTHTQRTYIMVKPDGVQRGLLGEIIGRFEKKGFKLQALKLATPPRSQLEAHYADLSSKVTNLPLASAALL